MIVNDSHGQKICLAKGYARETLSPLSCLSLPWTRLPLSIFLKSSIADLATIQSILLVFAEATGLRINWAKSLDVLIGGSDEHKAQIASILHYNRNSP